MDDSVLITWAGDIYPEPIAVIAGRIDQLQQWQTVKVGQGWWPLLVRLDEDLATLAPEYRITQIKQDMAQLHFGLKGPLREDVAEQMRALVTEAESASRRTCEECGEAGRQRKDTNGWVSVLCDDHAAPDR